MRVDKDQSEREHLESCQTAECDRLRSAVCGMRYVRPAGLAGGGDAEAVGVARGLGAVLQAQRRHLRLHAGQRGRAPRAARAPRRRRRRLQPRTRTMR